MKDFKYNEFSVCFFLKAFGIADDIKYSKNHEYVWKSVVMMSGVYLFYLVEKILKIMILRKKVYSTSMQ